MDLTGPIGDHLATKLERVTASPYRMLPCPLGVANANFKAVGLDCVPKQLELVTLAIGPDLGELLAVAVIGDCDPHVPGGIEVLQSFAVDERAYVAICEATRALLEPLAVAKFTGTINILTRTAPLRVGEKKPFYLPGLVTLASGGRA